MADDFNPLDFAEIPEQTQQQPQGGKAPATERTPSASDSMQGAEASLTDLLGGGDLLQDGLYSYDGQGGDGQPRGQDGKFVAKDGANPTQVDAEELASAARLAGGEVDGEGEGEGEGGDVDEFDSLFEQSEADKAAAGADAEGMVDVDGQKVALQDLKEAYGLIQDHELVAQELAQREQGLNQLEKVYSERIEEIQIAQTAIAGILRAFLEVDESKYGDTPEETVRYRKDIARAKTARGILQAAIQHHQKGTAGQKAAFAEKLKQEQVQADTRYVNHLRSKYPTIASDAKRMQVFQQRIYDVCAHFGVDKATVDANRDPVLLDVAVALAKAGIGRKQPEGSKSQPGGRKPVLKTAPAGSKTATPGKSAQKIDPRRLRDDVAQMKSGNDDAAIRILGEALTSGGLVVPR